MVINHENYFYDPNREIKKTSNRLPHWDQANTWIFVTWHMADSVPQTVLARLYEEKKLWLTKNPKPWNANQENTFQLRFFDKLETWLDNGYGASYFKNPSLANLMQNILLKDWKGISGSIINRLVNRTGSLWQGDYWDRLIRSEYHLSRIEDYIATNPKKGRLSKDSYKFYYQE